MNGNGLRHTPKCFAGHLGPCFGICFPEDFKKSLCLLWCNSRVCDALRSGNNLLASGDWKGLNLLGVKEQYGKEKVSLMAWKVDEV